MFNCLTVYPHSQTSWGGGGSYLNVRAGYWSESWRRASPCWTKSILREDWTALTAQRVVSHSQSWLSVGNFYSLRLVRVSSNHITSPFIIHHTPHHTIIIHHSTVKTSHHTTHDNKWHLLTWHMTCHTVTVTVRGSGCVQHCKSGWGPPWTLNCLLTLGWKVELHCWRKM